MKGERKMATLLQAYNRYGPRIQRGTLAGHEEIAAFIAGATGLDKHEIRCVLGKLQDALLHYARQGRTVKLEGIVQFWPTIDIKGTLSLGRRFDGVVTKKLNNLEKLAARVDNYERRTWEEQDYRDAWNAEFPDDPIVN
jgi:hypothetical protein